MKPLLSALGAGLLLAGCATAPADGNTATQQYKETASMTAHNTPLQISPEELLNRILDLMATSQSIQDFTLERLSEVLKVQFVFTKEENSYDAFGPITANWGYSFTKYKIEGYDRLRFSFNPLEVHGKPEMTEVCGMDFYEFVRKAEALGFTQEPIIGVDRRQTGVALKRGELRANILVWAEHPRSGTRPDPRGCIKHVVWS